MNVIETAMSTILQNTPCFHFYLYWDAGNYQATLALILPDKPEPVPVATYHAVSQKDAIDIAATYINLPDQFRSADMAVDLHAAAQDFDLAIQDIAEP